LISISVPLSIIVGPAPIDTTGVKTLTGLTWEQIVSQSPAAAKSTSYFIGQFGIAEAGFGLLTMGISALGYRKGERWAWYVLWFVPIILLGYVVTNFLAGTGTFWVELSVTLIVALLGLLLPIRRFFPKKQAVTS
jgi:hypothetical protein